MFALIGWISEEIFIAICADKGGDERRNEYWEENYKKQFREFISTQLEIFVSFLGQLKAIDFKIERF